MALPPLETYQNLMLTVRGRLDLIAAINTSMADGFSRAETAAFHGRKIVEGIAFGCLVATEHGIKHVPRDAKGQWSADSILSSLRKKKIDTLPSPSALRAATDSERAAHNVNATIVGTPDRRLSHHDLTAIYSRLHKWLHEINPYVGAGQAAFMKEHERTLWDDLRKLEQFIERHFISIHGRGFFCVLRDSTDGLTKVMPLDKLAELG